MKAESVRPPPFDARNRRSVFCSLMILAVLAICQACTLTASRSGLPPEVEATIGSVSADIEQERFEKLYNEASELWREAATLEQSTEVFKTLQTKLGRVENRTLHTATEQNNSGGPLKGRAYIVTYHTKFQNGEGMETFTLLERDNQWLLARYFVNSTALN